MDSTSPRRHPILPRNEPRGVWDDGAVRCVLGLLCPPPERLAARRLPLPYAGPEAAAITAALGGWAGNLTTDFFKILSRPIAKKFLESHPGIDENHHVSARPAAGALNAMRAVFERFAASW